MFLFCHDTTVSALGLLCKYFSVGTRVCERLLERRFDFQGDREGRPYNTKLPVFHVTVYCRGDPRGRPIGINLRTSPSAPVGAGVDEDVGLGRLRRPRPVPLASMLGGTRPPPHPAGDHKGPP